MHNPGERKRVGIDAMRASLSKDDAATLVARLTRDPDASTERRLYYPYFHFTADARLRWLFGERRMSVDCLVDARTARAASADALTLGRLQAERAECIAAEKGVAEAEMSARRYLSHALGRSLRVLGDSNLELAPATLVHRPYWVVRTPALRVLVDALTGEVHPLTPGRRRAA